MSGPSRVRVGVVGGMRLPGNVRTLLTNIRQLLDQHSMTFDLDLILSDGVDVPAGYEGIDPGFDDPVRALDSLRTLVGGLTSYAANCQVDLLFQVTKFPLHGSAATIAGWRTDTPVLTRFAGDNFREFRLSSGIDTAKAFGLNNVLGRVPIHWSDRVIVLGPYGRSEITGRNDDLPVTEIPQPVDREQFFPVPPERQHALASDLGFPESERVFLTVGRLTQRKGMTTLLAAAERLADLGEPVRWYVLGEGPMRQRLAEIEVVEPLGRVDFNSIADYYRAADLVVHPSHIEGLPNVLLEATACETPTIARDVGDCSMVASATFDHDAELFDLLQEEHEPATLGDRFAPARLRKAYANALLETSGED